MTITIKGNAQGGVVEANGAPAANVTSAAGLPFMKNKLINGEVTRINQRGVVNWAAVANGAYGYDRWKKIDASNMTQIIEAGNFRPNTVHTLSGIGVTTQQITSPASGNWTLPNIPITATNVQVEEGLEATPFEVRHIGFELSLCQRYYERHSYPAGAIVSAAVVSSASACSGRLTCATKRIVPSMVATDIICLTAAGTNAGGVIGLGLADLNGCVIGFSGAIGLVAGNASTIFANGANANVSFSAEL